MKKQILVTGIILTIIACMWFLGACDSVVAYLNDLTTSDENPPTLEVVKSSDIFYSESEFYNGVYLSVTRSDGENLKMNLNSDDLRLSSFDTTNGQKNITVYYGSYSASFSVVMAFNNVAVSYLASTGGTINGVSLQSVRVGDSTIAVTAVPSEGFEFSHWSDGVYTATRNHTNVGRTQGQQLTVYAIFKALTVSVEQYAFDGTLASTQKIYYGDTLSSMPTAADVEGYRFVRWVYKDSSDQFYLATPIKTNIAIVPEYERLSYKVTYFDTNSEGAISTLATYNVFYGEDLIASAPIPSTIPGQRFVKWVVRNDAEFKTPVLSDITSNIEIIPLRETIQYSVKYYSANSAGEEYSLFETSTAWGSTLTPPVQPVLNGYDFVGWCQDKATPTVLYNFDTEIHANIELYAVWSKIPVQVYTLSIYNDTEALYGTVVDTIPYEDGTAIGTLEPLADKEGYTFEGFVDSRGNAYSADYKITADYSVYATWEQIYLTVSYDADSTLGGEIVVGEYNGTSVAYGRYLSELSVPDVANALDSHNFVGWYLNGALYDFNTAITDNIELVAHWQIKTYTVSFISDTYGVTGNFPESGSVEVDYDGTISITVNVIEGVSFTNFIKQNAGDEYSTTPSPTSVVSRTDGSTDYTLTVTRVRNSFTIDTAAEAVVWTITCNRPTGVRTYAASTGSTGVKTAFPTYIITSPRAEVYHGANIAVEVTTEAGYLISSVTVNGVAVDVNNNVFVIPNIKQNQTVEVTAEIATYGVSWQFRNAADEIITGDGDYYAEYKRDANSAKQSYTINDTLVVDYLGDVEFCTQISVSLKFFDIYDVYVNGVLLDMSTVDHDDVSWWLYDIVETTLIVFKEKV